MALEWLPADPVNFIEETDNNSATFNCVASASDNHYVEIVISSSTLPNSLNITILKENDLPTGIRVTGSTPRIEDTETYYIVARLQEYHNEGSNKIIDEYKDAYFTIINNSVELRWITPSLITIDECYENTSFVKNIKDYLIGLNGDEVFRKIEGNLPHTITLSSTGILSGIPNRDDIGTYTFDIAVYRNNEIILEPHSFRLNVEMEKTDGAPVWITEGGLLNIVDASQSITDTKVIASINYNESTPASDKKITYEIIDGDLPSGLIYTVNSSNQCVISGTVLTTAVKEWEFTMIAKRMANGIEKISDPRTFSIITNKASKEHEIDWGESAIIDGGSYTVGSVINTSIPLATVTDGSIITYEVISKEDDFPKNINISEDGSLTGTIDFPETDEGFKAYTCVVKASTPYTYLVKPLQITILRGLGQNALNLSLKINLEYRNEYNEIRNQLNSSAIFGKGTEAYNIEPFPKIDIATLTCFDREILTGIFNYGTPEVVRFLETRFKTYSDEDVNGNPTETYEVYYKPVDEAYYYWDEIKAGPFDFEAELEKEKQITEEFGDKTTSKPFNIMDKSATLEFNNETNEPDPINVLNWEEADSSQPGNELYKIGTVDATVGNKFFKVFNFKNVRKMLQQPIYVYKKSGDYYYDMGNQQLFKKSDIAVKKLIEVDEITTKSTKDKERYKREEGKIKFYNDDWIGTKGYYGNKDEPNSGIKVSYYICDEDDANVKKVVYKDHMVYDLNGNLMVDILFKPNFDTHPFMIDSENYEIYNLEEIRNPWCIDRKESSWVSLDKVPEDKEMVLPRISDTDVIDNDHIILLDVTKEPLPKWKRKEAIYWEASTTYNVGDILYYNSSYYIVIKKYTSDFGFEYNQEYLRLLSNEEVKDQLSKQFLPTLDLGYYKPGKNRNYLNKLNEKEAEGKFWYRKDFLFWEVTCDPVYNQEIESFGVPFYSFSDEDTEKSKYNFILDVDFSGDYTATLKIEGVDIITASESIKKKYNYVQTGNTYKVTVDKGTLVDWSVSDGAEYFPEGMKEKIVSDITRKVTLRKKVTFTVNTTPEDAIVTLRTPEEIVVAKSMVVREGTDIQYRVEHKGYITQSGIHTITTTGTTDSISIELIADTNVTFTINTVPSDATVTMVVRGKIYVDNTVVVPKYSTITYSIEREGYEPILNAIITVEEDTVETIELRRLYTYTINPIPSDNVNVLITGPEGYYQVGNSISVPQGSTIYYSITKYGYVPVENVSRIVNSNNTETVELTKENYTFTVNVTNVEDATIVLRVGEEEYDTNTITVPYETIVTYTVSKENYKTVTGSEYIDGNKTKNITMVYKDCTLYITTVPDEATVKITALGEEFYSKTITVPYNTEVVYDATCEGYFPQLDKHITLTEDDTYLTVELESITYEYNLIDEEGNNLVSEINNNLISETYYKEHPINNNGD